MNRYFILFLLTYFAHSTMGQAEEKNDTVLKGKTGPDIVTVFPLVNDTNLKNSKYSVVYPLLVVNDAIISDTMSLNCFRNHFDKTKITKTKLISKEKAEKRGLQNIPKDGVLFVTTKKGYNFDFSCK